MKVILKAITPFIYASTIFLLLALIVKETCINNKETRHNMALDLSNPLTLNKARATDITLISNT